uniref:Putative unclassified retrotransposon protein n=1 Tax=Oryza sativa subsp. indica TaxID=39946 RepID=C5NNW0_ORYSI|nr:putative unclassified retrotransposon protein [Oryza sativa Indica Group]
MDSPATPVGLSPPLLSLVPRNEPCYTKDRSVHDRLTGEGDDDVGGDVTTGGGGSAARTAHARRRTAALRHERRTPTGRARRGELTGDQKSGGRSTDGDGDEEEAAANFGLTAARVFRRSSAAAKERTRTATTWRSRQWPSRATTTTETAAEHGWSDGGDGGARLHGARALPATRGKGEGGGG